MPHLNHRHADAYFSRRLRAIGHLFEAEDESQAWPELHTTIRTARKAYQAEGTMPDWELLSASAQSTTAETR